MTVAASRNASADPTVEVVRAADRARHRLRALFLVVAVLMVVFVAVAVLALWSIRSRTVDIAGNSLPSVRLIEEIRNDASIHRSTVLTHAITNDPARIDSLESAMGGVEESVRRNVDAYRALLSGKKDG